LPIRNVLGLKKWSREWLRPSLIGVGDIAVEESVDVGSNACTCRRACVDGG
jgi:hypothetical protein